MENRRRNIKKDLAPLLSEAVTRLRMNEPLSKHATLRIGGPASYFAEVYDTKELKKLLNIAVSHKLPFMIIGAGSNMLIGDKGYSGLVVKFTGAFCDFEFKKHILRAGAGVRLPVLVSKCMENGLAGMEALAGIPGTIGGALVSNAGTKNGWIGDIVKSVEILDKNGSGRVLKKKDLEFRYRGSNLEGKIILGAEFSLKKGKKNDILKKINDLLIKRAATQPLDAWSVGSIFKNPENDSAGRLIEAAGLKGLRFGGAKVSEKHANFIVNFENATASDMRNLISTVRHKVFEKSGVNLELEIKIIGD
ncbi:MAG: UDP-N-acetylmuramate dehydrogenase [Elusimicrobiota bacterium]